MRMRRKSERVRKSVNATAKKTEFGHGIYALSELQRYIAYQQRRQVAIHQVGYWIRHALAPAEHASHRPDYTFLDLKDFRGDLELQDPLRRLRPQPCCSIFTELVSPGFHSPGYRVPPILKKRGFALSFCVPHPRFELQLRHDATRLLGSYLCA